MRADIFAADGTAGANTPSLLLATSSTPCCPATYRPCFSSHHPSTPITRHHHNESRPQIVFRLKKLCGSKVNTARRPRLVVLVCMCAMLCTMLCFRTSARCGRMQRPSMTFFCPSFARHATPAHTHTHTRTRKHAPWPSGPREWRGKQR